VPVAHVEWASSAAVTPLGQLPFFIEFLKQGSVFDGWVADCPLHYTSPNAPLKRDVLGRVLLSVLAGHWRYAHMTALRCDLVNPPLLGMNEVVSEDAVRRGFDKIEEIACMAWLQGHLDYTTRPLLSEPWILDIDTTVKPLYGHQQGAVVSVDIEVPHGGITYLWLDSGSDDHEASYARSAVPHFFASVDLRTGADRRHGTGHR
jgi:hypothetical protein